MLVSPLAYRFSLDDGRVSQLAERLQESLIPLLIYWWDPMPGVGSHDQLADYEAMIAFCRRFPRLPVILWQCRLRNNRSLFDALESLIELKVIEVKERIGCHKKRDVRTRQVSVPRDDVIHEIISVRHIGLQDGKAVVPDEMGYGVQRDCTVNITEVGDVIQTQR